MGSCACTCAVVVTPALSLVSSLLCRVDWLLCGMDECGSGDLGCEGRVSFGWERCGHEGCRWNSGNSTIESTKRETSYSHGIIDTSLAYCVQAVQVMEMG